MENFENRIPNKLSDEIYAVYFDYKSDYTEEYTAILGVRVSSLNDIPAGLIGREFQTDTFTKFTAKGEMPNAVVEIWKEIWRRDKSYFATATQ